MKDKKRKWNLKTLMILVSLITFIIIFTFFFGDNGFIEILKKQKKVNKLKMEIQLLNKQKKELIEQIEKLRKDPYALEIIAREELWLMKSNEKVIIINRDEKKKKGTQKK